MSRRRVLPFLLCLLSTAGAARAGAQELRGTVRHPDGVTPASGVIVLLLHGPRDSIVARGVTGARGAFVVRAPAALAGTPLRAEARRVGHRPMSLGAVTLGAGETRTIDVSLVDMPVLLAAVNTREAARCEIRPDSGSLVATLYEEARKALMASAMQAAGTRSTATTVLFTRVENLRGRAVAPTQRNIVSGPSDRPFASLSADSLARVGYVTEEKDGRVYRAPDAEALLSDRFAAGHCLQVVDGTGERAPYVGIGFRPVASRRGYVDIRGTLWLDRSTTELQFLEFSYEGIPKEHQRGNVGGRVEFARTADGGWLVSRWAIRMPRITERVQEGTRSLRGGTVSGFAPIESVVDTIVVTGGEVQAVRVDGTLVYASAATLSADDVPESRGAQPAAVSTAAVSAAGSRVDTLSVESVCEEMKDRLYRGVVHGRVVDAARAARVGAIVVAEWKQDFQHVGGHEWRWEYRQLTTTTTADGRYTLCGAPLDRPITVALAATEGAAAARKTAVRRAGGVVVRLTAREPRGTADLADDEDRERARTATGAMLRIVDAAGEAVPHAVVTVEDGASRLADAEGRVVLPVASRDSLRVLVRRIGYAPFEGRVPRAPGTVHPVVLHPAAQQLAGVTVRARGERSALERSGFYDRMLQVQRGAMVGEFLTPEEIEPRRMATLSQLLSGRRYVRVLYLATAPGGKAPAVLAGRGGCPMTVYVDGQRMTDVYTGLGSSGSAMEIDQAVSAGSIVAIEVYPTAAGAPAQYQPPANTPFCGVALVWTGRR